jgi:hypothetical protein
VNETDWASSCPDEPKAPDPASFFSGSDYRRHERDPMTTEQVERLADIILARARELAARRPDEQTFMPSVGDLSSGPFAGVSPSKKPSSASPLRPPSVVR